MNPKHTPGPWEARLDDRWPEWNVHAPAKESRGLRYIIAENVNGDSSGPMYGTPEDNARLIAAAPELLEALTAICDMQRGNYGNGVATHIKLSDLCDVARTVIAKATGEPS